MQYEFEERNNQDIINLEIKCELISLMDRARHILDMNYNIKNVKSNWNGIQKMVEEIKNYQNKKTLQATWNRSNIIFWL